MNITADTNVLVRALVADDSAQAAEASQLLRDSLRAGLALLEAGGDFADG